MFVTVAICTWNRAKLLDQTLTRMRELRIPAGVEWELLVVNNNCTDDTDAVIARHSPHLPMRRLFESKPGLSNARNCALEYANGELVLWTDDDVLIAQEWIAEYVAAATAYPEATYFGGPIRPWFPETPPRWIRRHWDRVKVTWAILDQRSAIGPLLDGESIFGANMGFRRNSVSTYKFDPQLGRKGTSLMSAEETIYLQQLKRDGHQGVWVGSAPVDHYIPANRLTADYVWELHRCTYRIESTCFQNDPSPRIRGVPRWMLRKYLVARFKAQLLSVYKDSRWLNAFLESAKWQGVMDTFNERHACSGHKTNEAPPGKAEMV